MDDFMPTFSSLVFFFLFLIDKHNLWTNLCDRVKVTGNKVTNNFYIKKSLEFITVMALLAIIAMYCSLRWLEKTIVLSSTGFTSVKKQACFSIFLFPK